MTLEKIRAALPTHIMLTPGVHRWREGDEFFYDDKWIFIEQENAHLFRKLVDDDSPARRPIPPHILDNQAWWALYDELAELQPFELGVEPYINSYGLAFASWDNCHGIKKFKSIRGESDYARECVAKLGGDDLFVKIFKAGPLYDKWLLEQMEGA